MEDNVVDPHDKMRGELGSIADAPPPPPDGIIELRTAHARFPFTNQTRHCYARYREYHQCVKAKGPGSPECEKFARWYRSLCPTEWIVKWNEQREMGVFPGPL